MRPQAKSKPHSAAGASRAAIPGWVFAGVLSGASFAATSLGCGDDGAGDATTASGGSSSGGSSGSSSGGTPSGGAAGSGGGGTDAGAPTGPTRYATDATLSPVTDSVAARLRAIAKNDPTRTADVFMKAGASGTVSKSFLFCFAGPSQPDYELDLAGHVELMPSIELFRGGDAAGTTPFDRATLAAEIGRSASWVIAGAPSPLEQEIQAINPRFAFVNYGTNDMQQAASYLAALFPFHENLSLVLDQLEARGIVPIVTGLNPRSDSAEAARWVPTWDAVTRAIAQARQLPYLSLYFASKDLPGMGLSGDGLHGNVLIQNGSAEPCVFSAAGLEHNYNVRNLLSMALLAKAKAVVVDQASAPDAPGAPFVGLGSAEAPLSIDPLPFIHSASTSTDGARRIDGYSGCNAAQDESGPELYYRLELSEPTPIRALLLDRTGTDVDLHLLAGAPEASACLARHDRSIQGTLGPGTYYFVVDSFVSGGVEQGGAYDFVVLRCEAQDTACSNAL